MLTVPIVLVFLLSVILQVIMLAMLPLTKGYTVVGPTVVAVVCINIAIWLFARIVNDGIQLSFLVPISATVIPLSVIAVSVVAYGEPMPLAKVALLVVASVMIGVASGMK